MKPARLYRPLPLTVNGLLQAFSGLENDRHGVISEDLQHTEWHPGPHPQCMELLTRCIRLCRFDLLEKAASARMRDSREMLEAALLRVHGAAIQEYPRIGKSDLLEIFKELEPVLAKHLPKSERGTTKFLDRIGLKGMPQARGYGDRELKNLFKAIRGS